MSRTETSQADELIERILKLTKSPQSIPFYRKIIEALGLGVVDSELGELRYRLHSGEIKDPARYFTTLLQNRMPDREASSLKSEEPAGSRQVNEGSAEPIVTMGGKTNNFSHRNSFHSPSALELFDELKPIASRSEGEGRQGALDFPYSNKTIPWATFIGPEFFTLPTNKAKSDQVIARFWTFGGKLAEVPMLRGRFFPRDVDRGIPVAEEGRILGGMACMWVDQGCRFTEFGNGSVCCFCRVPIRELAKMLGWKTFGGNDLAHLKQKIINLKTKGYYLELDAVEEFRKDGLKGFGFSLIDGIDLVDKTRHRLEQTTFRVRFSDPYSRQLLARRVVSRQKELLTIRGDIGFLLRLYLDPILMSRGAEAHHSIELANLIKRLNLPSAGWHNEKSHRKAIFSHVIKELNDLSSSDGRTLSLAITQGQNAKDLMLVADLKLSSDIAERAPELDTSRRS